MDTRQTSGDSASDTDGAQMNPDDEPDSTAYDEYMAEKMKTGIDVLAPSKGHKPHRTPFIGHLSGRYPSLYRLVRLQKYTEVVESVFKQLKLDPKKQPGYLALLDLRQQIEERSSSISAERSRQIVEMARSVVPEPKRRNGFFGIFAPKGP